MKINCSKEELVNGVATIQSALSSRTTLPILLNFLLETENLRVKVISTDLEMGVKHYIPAEVESDGSITIPAKKFADILHSLPDGQDIELSVDIGSKIQLKCGRSRFGIIGAPKSEYPVLPEPGKQNYFEITPSVMAEMIEKTIFAASTDETRHILNGVFWNAKKGNLEMVATDGRRLSIINKKILPPDYNFSVIVPTKILSELGHILNSREKAKVKESLHISITENQIAFQLKTTTLISRLVGGSFPNYQQVIPQKKDVTLKIETESLLAVTKRASLCAIDRGGSVRYTLRKGSLTISSSSQNLEFTDELPLDYSGQEFQIAFNPQFMIDALKHVDSKEVLISLTTPVNPVMLEPAGGGDYHFVVMPMRG